MTLNLYVRTKNYRCENVVINDIPVFLVAGSLRVMVKFRASWAILPEWREVIAGYSSGASWEVENEGEDC